MENGLKMNNDAINGLKAVIIRSNMAGVHYGYMKECKDTLSGRIVTLVNTRRVWAWSGAATLSQMALEGVKDPENCKFSVRIAEIEIVGVVEIIPLTSEALENLNAVPEWRC